MQEIRARMVLAVLVGLLVRKEIMALLVMQEIRVPMVLEVPVVLVVLAVTLAAED
jgi:hypothetical protein